MLFCPSVTASPQKGLAGTPPLTAPPVAGPPDCEVGPLVVGFDTPCQRAIIRAHKAEMHGADRVLSGAVAELKQQLYQWVGQEKQWSSAWGRMIDELDTV